LTAYNHATGAINSVQDANSTNHTAVVFNAVGDSGYPYITFTTATSGATFVYLQHISDTGW
jgi:hypothetical protein